MLKKIIIGTFSLLVVAMQLSATQLSAEPMLTGMQLSATTPIGIGVPAEKPQGQKKSFKKKRIASPQKPRHQKPDRHLAKVVRRVIRHSRDHKEKAYAKRRAGHSAATATASGSKGASNSRSTTAGGPTTGLPTVDETADLQLSADFGKHKGQLPWPLTGTVSMPFGPYEYMPNVHRNNVGITVDAAEGTIVKAVYQGEVTAIEDIGGVWCVIVRHGKYHSAYSNLSSTTVVKGQQVSVGDSLGRIGDTGQLEFLLMNENGGYVDPQKWLKR